MRSSRDWFALLDQAPHTRLRLAGARPIAPPSIHSARSQQIETCAGDSWIAVGDAASTFDPLSSQGIYNALRSGMFAACAILDARKGSGADGFAKYERFVRDEYNEYRDARSHYYAQEQRWPDAAFWKRRHESITLDPVRLLHARDAAQVSGGMHLTGDEAALIRGLCASPRAAHDVVREFTSRADRPIPRRRAVLALQYLLDRGVIHTT